MFVLDGLVSGGAAHCDDLVSVLHTVVLHEAPFLARAEKERRVENGTWRAIGHVFLSACKTLHNLAISSHLRATILGTATMSFGGIPQPPPSLSTPGQPPVSWVQRSDTFENYMLPPEHRNSRWCDEKIFSFTPRVWKDRASSPRCYETAALMVATTASLPASACDSTTV